MCSGAILLYGIPRVVIGENVTFIGSRKTTSAKTASPSKSSKTRNVINLMRQFISSHPTLWNEDIGI